MKAYFIDAWSETITEVDTKGYDNTRKLIRAKMIECYPYQVNGNDIITDEEANLKQYNHFFTIDDCIVSGSALVMGSDGMGEWIAPKNLTLEELKVLKDRRVPSYKVYQHVHKINLKLAQHLLKPS